MGTSRPVWSTRRRSWSCSFAVSRSWVAGRITIVVGTILSAVNQGSVILAGNATGLTWTPIAVNYLIPFVVASIGYHAGCRAKPGSPRSFVAGPWSLCTVLWSLVRRAHWHRPYAARATTAAAPGRPCSGVAGVPVQ